MKIISFLLLLISISSGLFAQTPPEIQKIRDHYNSVQEQIHHAELNPGESNFYLNELKENVHNGSWRAIGYYNRTLKFWYDDIPGYICAEEIEEFGGDDACHLQFIVEEVHNGVGGWHAEYLFDNGVLMFAFLTDEMGERRYYWKDGKMIRAQIEDDIYPTAPKDFQEDAEWTWKAGQKFRQQYISLFQ